MANRSTRPPPHVSRRGLLGGLAGTALMGAAAPSAATDPVLALAAAWLKGRDATDTLALKWQRLETELWAKHGPLSIEEGSQRGIREAQQMRAIDRRLDRMNRRLTHIAHRLRGTHATTVQGSIAKLSIVLTMLEPTDCGRLVWGLLGGAITDLSRQSLRLS